MITQATIDLRMNQLQGTGRCPSHGLTLAQAVVLVTDLGLDPRHVELALGGDLRVIPKDKR